MPLPTSRVYFSPREVRIVLPGLECLVNRFATAQLGSYPHRDPRWLLKRPEISSVSFDPDMHQKVLYARNALKWINNSRQPRLDCLEIAAIAVALRLVRREKLVPDLKFQEFHCLDRKLEKYRKRARRAAERVLGEQGYQQVFQRWHLLLDWMHIHIFHFGPLPGPQRTFLREQREQTRNFALSMVTDNANRKVVCHLADLARREVRRGRHGTTLRELLADQEQTVKLFTRFLVNRLALEFLKPEFQPHCVLASERSEKFQAATVVAVD